MQLSGSRFLVTGGSGFIGLYIVEQLLEADASAVVVFDKSPRPETREALAKYDRVHLEEGDVTDPTSLERALQEIDGVFHLAVLPLIGCEEDPRACLEVNVVGTFNVLDAARACGARKIVFSSASSVYGDTLETMDEDHPLNARTMYGASKIAGEYLVRAWEQKYALPFVTLRYMNVYGPRQAGGLIASVLQRIRSGERPVIMGEGSQSFDFVHVADVASANLAAMASDLSGEAFNVGGGNEVTVKEIVEQLLRLTGSELEPEYRRDAAVLMTRRVGSNERAVKRLGWRPSYDLEAGLRTVVDASTLP